MSKKHKGINRKYINTDSELDTPTHTPPLTISHGITKKQHEALLLLSQGFNISQIARKLGNVDESAIRCRLKFCIRKGLIFHEFGIYKLTEAGNLALKLFGVGVGVSEIQKSQHKNEFLAKIKGFPNNWRNANYVQFLTAKHTIHNASTKTWFIYFEDCTTIIHYAANKVIFKVKEQLGGSFDETDSKSWDVFVKNFKIIKANGFDLDNTISSENPHFANSEGFFAKLAAFKSIDGFRIDTDEGSFWVDYSLGKKPEEETDNLKYSKRVEDIAHSIIDTHSDFRDLDKLIEVSLNLVKITANLTTIQANQLIPKQQEKKDSPEPKKGGDYFG